VGCPAGGSVVSLPLVVVVVPKNGYVQCYMNTCSSARKMYGKFELCYACLFSKQTCDSVDDDFVLPSMSSCSILLVYWGPDAD
jgi:hypothetical protein